jgi:tetratricopeptide (TPR) repeat protein
MRVALVLCLVAVIRVTAAAQDYRAIVDAYRREGNAQITQVLEMPRADVRRFVGVATEASSPWSWEEQRAAAMLHSEAALQLIASRDAGGADEHLELAQRLLARVAERAPAQDDYAWRWHRVMIPLVAELGARGLAPRLRAYADARWGRNAALASFLHGLQAEWHGNSEGRILAPGSAAAFVRAEDRQDHWFASAALAYSEALRQDPSLEAAALHLGRVRMIQGHRTEAAGLFKNAVDASDPAVAYMAALFLGSIEEREEHFDEAEKWYRQAAAKVPYGQSAPLALAQLLSRAGRDEEGRALLAARLKSPTRSMDPLWAYVARPDQELGTRFDLLRVEVWR